MIVCKTKRYKNSWISYNRTAKFRDSLVVFGKRRGHVVFMSNFNNIYITYQITSIPVGNGTYKIKITTTDDYNNESAGTEGTQIIAFYPLPPKSLAGSVSGNNVTLTWAHSINGAPTNYKVYGNGGSGNIINRDTPLATLAGSLLTSTFAVANGQWKFVVESVTGSVESRSLITVTLAVPSTAVIPPSPGPSVIDSTLSQPTGLMLEQISVGKVKIRFYWSHGTLASSFNIYHDSGTGTINYAAPAFSFARQSSLIQLYTTTQLHALDSVVTYKFVVRAVSANGVEETNTDEYSIEVDGAAPDNIVDLTLDSVF